MQHFSDEYLTKLVAEHRLVSASIGRLNQQSNRYLANHSVDSVHLAISNLRAKKVELECQIDVLSEYLTG